MILERHFQILILFPFLLSLLQAKFRISALFSHSKVPCHFTVRYCRHHVNLLNIIFSQVQSCYWSVCSFIPFKVITKVYWWETLWIYSSFLGFARGSWKTLLNATLHTGYDSLWTSFTSPWYFQLHCIYMYKAQNISHVSSSLCTLKNG